MTHHRPKRHPALELVAADQGAQGPAALARRWLDVPSDMPGVMCRQVVEPGPMAGMRLDQRMYDAAATLARLWQAAQPGLERPRGFRTHSSGPSLTPAQEAAAGAAMREYQAALDAVQWDAGLRAVWAVEAAAVRREPADHRHLAAGLIALADHFQSR